jgi:hypothetical protein
MMSALRTLRKKSSSTHFDLPWSDIPRQFDAIFIGSNEFSGEVVAQAGPDGQRAIERIFPNTCIAWRKLDASNQEYLPDDWREFCFIVPQLVNLPGHGLRSDLLALVVVSLFRCKCFASAHLTPDLGHAATKSGTCGCARHGMRPKHCNARCRMTRSGS